MGQFSIAVDRELNLTINNGSTWTNTGGDTELSDVSINQGYINFTHAKQAADVGKKLTVNNWYSNHAVLAFQVGQDNDGKRLTDTLIIDGGNTSGYTYFALHDLTDDIYQVKATKIDNQILDQKNGGTFNLSNFGGSIDSGLYNYDIEMFQEGTFIPILSSKKPTIESEGNLNIPTRLINGYQSPIVFSLGNFQHNFKRNELDLQDSCRSYQTFVTYLMALER